MAINQFDFITYLDYSILVPQIKQSKKQLKTLKILKILFFKRKFFDQKNN